MLFSVFPKVYKEGGYLKYRMSSGTFVLVCVCVCVLRAHSELHGAPSELAGEHENLRQYREGQIMAVKVGATLDCDLH